MGNDEPSTAAPRTTRRQRLRRWRRVGYVLALLLIIAWLTRFWTVVPLARDQLLATLGDRFGGTWELAAITRLDLQVIEIEGLELVDPDPDRGLRSCRIERLRIDLDPLGALAGFLHLVEGVRVDGATIRVDSERPLLVELDEDEDEDEDSHADGAGDPLAWLDLLEELDTRFLIDASVAVDGDRSIRGRLIAGGRADDAHLLLDQLRVDGRSCPPAGLRIWLADPGELRWTITPPALDPAAGWLRRSGDTWAVAARPIGGGGWELTGDQRQLQFSCHDWDPVSAWRRAGLLPSDFPVHRLGCVGSIDVELAGGPRLVLDLAIDAEGAAEQSIGQGTIIADCSPTEVHVERAELRWRDHQLLATAGRWRRSTGLSAGQLQWSTKPARWPLDDQPIEATATARVVGDELVVEGSGTGSRLSATLSGRLPASAVGPGWRRAAFDLQLSASGSTPVGSFGSWELDLTGQGNLDDPRGTLRLTGTDLSLTGADPTDLELDLTLGADRATLERCRFTNTNGTIALEEPSTLSWQADGSWRLSDLRLGDQLLSLRAAGTLDRLSDLHLDCGPLPLGTLSLIRPDWPLKQGTASVAARWQDEPRQARLDLSLQDCQASLPGRQLPDTDLAVNASGDADGIQASTSLRSGDTEILTGTVSCAAGLPPAPWLVSDLYDAALEGSVSGERLPVAWLAALVPDLTWASGRADVSARVGGTVAGPLFDAAIDLQSVRIASGGSLPPLDDLTGRIALHAGGLQISELSGTLGGGRITLDGTFAIRPEAVHDLRLQGDQALLINQPQLRLRADSDLHLTGSGAEPVLSGTIGVTDLRYSDHFSPFNRGDRPAGPDDPLVQLFSIDTEPWNRLRFDLRIRDGQLDRPASEATDSAPGLQVRTNFFKGRLHADLLLQGTGEVPEPQGVVQAREGRLDLPFTSYRIIGARVRFQREDPFDPLIDLTATTRMRSYDVRLQAEGRLRDPRLTVTTSPSLPADDALLFATTGLLQADVQEEGAASALTAVPYLLKELKHGIFGPADPDAEPGLLDRLEFRFDEDRSDSGEATAVAELRLTHHWYLFAERDRYEEYNGGLLWRWTIGEAPPPLEGTDIEDPELDSEWRVEPAETVEELPISQRTVLVRLRPIRRSYNQSDGDPIHLADASHIITQKLQAVGHHRARVNVDESQAPELVVFRLIPGQLWRWSDVRVHGMPEDLAEQLDPLIGSRLAVGEPFVASAAKDAAGAIERALLLAGHRDALVLVDGPHLHEENATAEVTLTIDAGPRYHFAVPRITGMAGLPVDLREDLLATVFDLTGKRWLKRSAVAVRAKLETLLRDHGYVWGSVTIALPEEAPWPTTVPVTFEVAAGEPAHLLELQWRGFEDTALSYVRSQFHLEEGDLLRGDKLQAGLDRLRSRLPLRRLQSDIEAVDGDPSRVRVLVEAEEAPSQHLDIHIGWGSYEQLRGGIRWRDENLFGWGRNLSAGLQASTKHREALVDLADRDLLGDDRTLSLGLRWMRREEPSFTESRISAEPGVSWRLTRHQSLRLAYRWETARASDREAGIADSEFDGFVDLARLEGTWTWNRLDDRWLPTSGWLVGLGFGIVDRAIGADVDYIEPRIELGGVVPLRDDGAWTVAAFAEGIVRKPTDGAPSLPIQERLFLGGPRDVRSFDGPTLAPVDPATGEALGGLTAVFAQLETRIRLTGRWHLALFGDIGAVGEDAYDLPDDYGIAVGLGLRFHLPVGPLRLDAAYNPGEQFAENDDWALHLAVGFTF